jgi:acetyltransferase
MTYQIHRYPAELIDVVRLGDGERVVIRPVLPQDEDLTTAFFRNLSAPARYDRFMTSLRELPPELMRRFTQVDYADHLALVAEVFAGGRETVIAEARYVRMPNSLDAEFAVSVAEPWQGKKLASLLLGKLACRAAAMGVRRIVGETLATNAKMISRQGPPRLRKPRGSRPDAAGEGATGPPCTAGDPARLSRVARVGSSERCPTPVGLQSVLVNLLTQPTNVARARPAGRAQGRS